MTTNSVSKEHLSDERLASWADQAEKASIRGPGMMGALSNHLCVPPNELYSILTELQSLRTSSGGVTSGEVVAWLVKWVGGTKLKLTFKPEIYGDDHEKIPLYKQQILTVKTLDWREGAARDGKQWFATYRFEPCNPTHDAFRYEVKFLAGSGWGMSVNSAPFVFSSTKEGAQAAAQEHFRSAITAALSSLHAQPSGNSGELPDQGTGSREAVAWRVDDMMTDGITSAGTFNFYANKDDAERRIADAYKPHWVKLIPLVPLSQLQAVELERDEAIAKWHAADGMEGAVSHAIRELMNHHNVPLSAFIDDHVANAIRQRNDAEASLAAAREALTPSGDTKAAYMGEFYITVDSMNEEGEDESQHVSVPWTTIKEIMASISARAALAGSNPK